MFKTPILYVPFKRIDIVKQVLNRILDVNPEKLYVFQDGPRDQSEERVLQEVMAYIEATVGKTKTKLCVNRNANNLGPYRGVWEAVSWFFEYEKEGIILEEDIYPSFSFFYFCQKLLKHYKDNKDVWVIVGKDNINQGNIEDVYFLKTFFPPWGFATWRDRWEKMDFYLEKLKNINIPNNINERYKKAIEGLLNLDIQNFGWDVRFDAFIKAYGGFVARSKKNLVKHIGWENATHYSKNDAIDEEIYEIDVNNMFIPDDIIYNDWIENLNLEKWKPFDSFAGLFSPTFQSNLKNILNSSLSIFIYGAGFLGRMMYFIYDDLFGDRLLYFIDDNAKGNIKDIPIVNLSNVEKIPDTIIVSVARENLIDDILNKIRLRFPESRIYTIKDIMFIESLDL